MTVKIKVKKLYEDSKLPTKATEYASGWDIYAYIDNLYSQNAIVKPGERMTVPTGISVEIPEGYEIQCRGRSGLAKNHGIFAHFGTIDSDYRGEMAAIIFNNSFKDFVIRHGDRIAQLVVAPVIKAEFIEVEELSSTERGNGGFGSTGR